jgi:hypothetical protein
VKCSLEGHTYLESVDLNSQFVPANIKGLLIQTQRDLHRDYPLNVAISLNGTIAGTTETYIDHEGATRFSLVLSDSTFRSGYNQVGIYLISKAGDHFELLETEGTDVPPYRWGDVLLFGSNGNGVDYRVGGWSDPEEKFTWTDGKKAELVLPTATPQGAICLRFSACPYLRPGILNRQRLKLAVNRHPVAEWNMTGSNFETREVTIPPEFFDGNRTILTFDLPDSAIPSSIADGIDLRRLGLAMAWLSLTEKHP